MLQNICRIYGYQFLLWSITKITNNNCEKLFSWKIHFLMSTFAKSSLPAVNGVFWYFIDHLANFTVFSDNWNKTRVSRIQEWGYHIGSLIVINPIPKFECCLLQSIKFILFIRSQFFVPLFSFCSLSVLLVTYD